MTFGLRAGLVSGITHSKYGGPATVLRMHYEGLSRHADVSVFGVVGPGETSDVLQIFPKARLFDRVAPARWYRGRGLMSELSKAAECLDVLHAHMLWDHAVYATWRSSRRAGKPFVVTPHGSLSARWRYRSAWKTVYRHLVLDGLLRDVACLHVLTSNEEAACRDLGVRCPIRVIPNGLPLEEFERMAPVDAALEAWPLLRGRRILLYVGRLWSEKGLDILPQAWADACKSGYLKDWILVIAGPDYRGYRRELEARIDALAIRDTVLFVGAISGPVKAALLSACDCFVLPSHGEGFSMALLEAVAARRPAVFTPECNFSELAAAGGGWEVGADVQALAEALRSLAKMDRSFLDEAGRRGWEMARQRFTMNKVIDQLLSMYRDAINGR